MALSEKECKFCLEPITWVENAATGKPTPLEAEATTFYVVEPNQRPGITPRAKVVVGRRAHRCRAKA